MRLGGIKGSKANSRDSISKALFQREGERCPGKDMLLAHQWCRGRALPLKSSLMGGTQMRLLRALEVCFLHWEEGLSEVMQLCIRSDYAPLHGRGPNVDCKCPPRAILNPIQEDFLKV